MELDDAKAFIDAVEKLAFSIPAPNQYTPQLVQLCVAARVAQANYQNRLHTVLRKRPRGA